MTENTKETICFVLGILLFIGVVLFACINVVENLNALSIKQNTIIEKCEKKCFDDFGCLEACYQWEARK